MGIHWDDVGRDWHPEVGGQAEAAVGEQVDVLCHVGITRFEREVGGQHHTGTEAGLHTLIGLALHGEC